MGNWPLSQYHQWWRFWVPGFSEVVLTLLWIGGLWSWDDSASFPYRRTWAKGLGKVIKKIIFVLLRKLFVCFSFPFASEEMFYVMISNLIGARLMRKLIFPTLDQWVDGTLAPSRSSVSAAAAAPLNTGGQPGCRNIQTPQRQWEFLLLPPAATLTAFLSPLFFRSSLWREKLTLFPEQKEKSLSVQRIWGMSLMSEIMCSRLPVTAVAFHPAASLNHPQTWKCPPLSPQIRWSNDGSSWASLTPGGMKLFYENHTFLHQGPKDPRDLFLL